MCDPDTEGEKKKGGGGEIHLGLNAEKLQNTWVKGVLFLLAITSISAKVRPFTPHWAEQHRAWAQSTKWWHVCLCLVHFPPSMLLPLPTKLCQSFHSF